MKPWKYTKRELQDHRLQSLGLYIDDEITDERAAEIEALPDE